MADLKNLVEECIKIHKEGLDMLQYTRDHGPDAKNMYYLEVFFTRFHKLISRINIEYHENPTPENRVEFDKLLNIIKGREKFYE